MLFAFSHGASNGSRTNDTASDRARRVLLSSIDDGVWLHLWTNPFRKNRVYAKKISYVIPHQVERSKVVVISAFDCRPALLVFPVALQLRWCNMFSIFHRFPNVVHRLDACPRRNNNRRWSNTLASVSDKNLIVKHWKIDHERSIVSALDLQCQKNSVREE